MKSICLIILVLILSVKAFAEEVLKQTKLSRENVTEDYLLVKPKGKPFASLILFAGSEGALHLKDGEPYSLKGNFLVRNRSKFADEGFWVAVVDAPSDHSGGMESFRTTKDHSDDIAVLIKDLRKNANLPIWLIGTSRGTISAANTAARIKEQGADGLVLTSTVTAGRKSTIYDVPFADIAIPTLVVRHKNDGCMASPSTSADSIVKALVKAPKTEILTFEGGEAKSDPCEGKSYHGYFGIDDKVVKEISDWIKKNLNKI